MKRKNKQKASSKKIEFGKSTIKRLDKIHKECDKLFEEDKILIKEIRKEINAQHRKAS